MDNNLQIFSLKSNLISNAQARGASINFNNQKYNPHMRMKSLCFSNMLQTIRNMNGKDNRQEDKQMIDNQKQNNTMIVQAKHFKIAYGHDTPLVVQPPRMVIPHSRSFLIRSHNQKKGIIASADIKTTQNSKQICVPTTTYQIQLNQYNFKSAEQLRCRMVAIPKNNILPHPHLFEQQITSPQLTVLINSNLIKTQTIGLLSLLFDKLVSKNMWIIIICISKQKAYKLHQLQLIKKHKHIHIIYPDAYCQNSLSHYSAQKPSPVMSSMSHHSEGEKGQSNNERFTGIQASTAANNHYDTHGYHTKSRQVFIDMSSLKIEIADRLLVVQSSASHQTAGNVNSIHYRQKCLYFPYYPSNNHEISTYQLKNSNKKYKVAFLKLPSLNLIKDIQILEIQGQQMQCLNNINTNLTIQEQIKGTVDNKPIQENQIPVIIDNGQKQFQQAIAKQQIQQIQKDLNDHQKPVQMLKQEDLQNKQKQAANQVCDQVCILTKIKQQAHKVTPSEFINDADTYKRQQKAIQAKKKDKLKIQIQHINSPSLSNSNGQNQRKPSLIIENYPLSCMVKLQLEKKNRIKTGKNRYSAQLFANNRNFVCNNTQVSSRFQSENRLGSSVCKNQIFTIHVNQMEGLQQKLFQYAKILKKQLEERQSIDKENGQIVHTSHTGSLQTNPNSMAMKQQGRKSLNSKSYYQVISQLIRNNQNIHKQINSYVNQCKDICFCSLDQVLCDDISYYLYE